MFTSFVLFLIWVIPSIICLIIYRMTKKRLSRSDRELFKGFAFIPAFNIILVFIVIVMFLTSMLVFVFEMDWFNKIFGD